MNELAVIKNDFLGMTEPFGILLLRRMFTG
jgi:hypothetical protein